jgi:hypothetical protein
MQCLSACLKKVSVKTNRKILSLAVKLDVIRRIEEAGERQIDVCKALRRARINCTMYFEK